MAESVDFVYRDYNTQGVPTSGDHEPRKPEIRALLKQIQNSSGQSVTRNTLAQLTGVTPPNENYMGIVLTGAGAGYYSRVAGVWTFGRGFPDTFTQVDLAGSGTVQTGSLNVGVSPSSVEVFYAKVATPNTGPLTLSISGGPARSVRNLAGNTLSAGEWTGMVMFFLNDAGQYQLLLDISSAQLAITAAQAAADAADRAEEALSDVLEGVVPNASVSRSKLSIGLSKSVPRTLLEINPIAGQDDGTVDSAAINELFAATRYPIITPAEAGFYKVNKLQVPNTVKLIEGKGDVFFKANPGSLTEGAWKGAWVSTGNYVAGDIVHFLVTFDTIGIPSLAPTGLMYKAKQSSSNTPPDPGVSGANNAYWDFVPFANFWEFSNVDDLTMTGIGFDLDSDLFPHARTLAFLGCDNVRTDNLRFRKAGGMAIYGGNCTDVLHTGMKVKRYAYMGGRMEGASQADVGFANCHVDAGGIATAHGLSIGLGKRGYIDNCISKNAGVFGMSVDEIDVFRISGLSLDSKQEGFNTISGKNGQINGAAKWDNVLSIDFGVSIDGTTGSGVYNVNSDVVVERSGVSAFVFTGTVTDCTAHVIARNCNQTGAADEAGILFSGINCQRNTGYITLVDQYGPHRMGYAIAEINKGNGAPANNKLVVENSIGALVQDVKRLGPTSKVFGMTTRTSAAAVTGVGGTGLVGTASIEWNYDGEDVVLKRVMVDITNIGSGNTSVSVALPVLAVLEGGLVTFKDYNNTRDIFSGEIGTGAIVIQLYEGSFGVTATSKLAGHGRYKAAA